MIVSRVLILLVSLLLATACGATRPEFSEIPDDNSEYGLVSIAYLKSLCKGLSATIKSDISIKGVVVANDHFGEFYKSLVVVDESGGVEIAIDRERLCVDFPLYTSLSVTCNGLAVGRVGGKVTLGAEPTGEYTVDRIADVDISKYLLCHNEACAATPREVTIAGLGVENVSDYVMLRNVRFVDEDVGRPWCESVDGEERLATDRCVVDVEGNRLIVRVSPHSDYAGEKIPSGSGTLCGILDYSGGDYLLRITNHEIFF